MLLDNLIIEAWGANMEKISLECLARRLYISNISNCKLCLIELPEKKLYRIHNMENGSFTNYYCKGIFIGYDRSSSCLFALLEDVYYQRDTGRRNVATYYCMSRDRANTIFQQLVSDSKESPIIPIRNFREKDYVAYGGEIFL